MWKTEVDEVTLVKGEKGLGFSILDYQDPLNSAETVIVVRSLVPGGVAHLDGRLVAGDRIMYVNSARLEHASLDAAVQALKGAPFGPVKIGIAQPLPDGEEGATEMMGQLRDKLAASGTSGCSPSSAVAPDLHTNNTNSDVNTISTEEVSQSNIFLSLSICKKSNLFAERSRKPVGHDWGGQ